MADSGGDDRPLRESDRHDPTLREKLVGGLQWSITAAYAFFLGFLAVAWYLRANRELVSLDASRPFVAVVLAAFAGGYLWVALRSRSEADAARAHARRVEVVLALLVFGFLLPFGASLVRERVGPTAFPLLLFEFAVAYAATIALSYGLVYGLGIRPFLGRPERPDLEE